jgi:hypothetical protein
VDEDKKSCIPEGKNIMLKSQRGKERRKQKLLLQNLNMMEEF